MFELPPRKSKEYFLSLTEDQKNALTENDAYDYMEGGTLGDHLQWPILIGASSTVRQAIEKMLFIRKCP